MWKTVSGVTSGPKSVSVERLEAPTAKRRLWRGGTGALLAVAVGLAACSSLPEDGPSARMVTHQAAATAAKQSYGLVDLDYRATQVIDANPAEPLAALSHDDSDAPNDIIARGDTLAVSIYEPGMIPLAPNLTATATPEVGVGPQSLPRSVVDDHGAIVVPYAGSVVVAGDTPNQAAGVIRHALQGKVADPQVIVTTISSPRNSVVVIGEVGKPGRYPLTSNGDRLLDFIAIAGGATRQARDLTVTVVRGDQSVSIVLQTLLDDPTQNVRLGPQDQVRVTASPRKIDVFGAVGRGSEIPIEDDTLTLAGALARIGGLNPASADARSVLVFRFERPEVARALGVSFPDVPGLKQVPIVYRLNLRDPAGYFVANKFQLVSHDLIYVPTADLAELQKFLLVVNSAAQFFYDASVAKTL
jgi:polysaccharide export outer membrane protein